jgi:hypothetical protein
MRLSGAGLELFANVGIFNRGYYAPGFINFTKVTIKEYFLAA